MKLRKLLSSLIAFGLFLNLGSLPVLADNDQIISNDAYIVTIDNATYEFASYEDYCKYIADHESNDINLCTSSGTDYVSSVVLSRTKYYQWVGYHSYTPYWSMASSYTLTAGRTYSASGNVSSDGFSFGVSISYSESISITYPADSSRYSKLGVYADLKLVRYKYDVYEYGTYSYSYYVNTSTIISRYVKVVYK